MSASETRWLSADEQSAWRMFLAACQTVFSAVDGQLQRDYGIPHGYYEILVRLSEAPDHALRMSQLAEASTSSKSRLSHAVARLEERGWIVRLSCPTDRRGQIAQLTDDGFKALAHAAPGHVEQVRRSMIDLLSPEQIGQLQEISTALAAGGRPWPSAGAECPGAADADDESYPSAADPADEPCPAEASADAEADPGAASART
jgi:DNA-binding MarR family transcriptional regulator